MLSPSAAAASLLPCWANDLSLLDNGANEILRQRVQALNESQEDAAKWYDGNLSSMERARMILEGIKDNNYRHVWATEHLDQFVSNMNTILRPSVTFHYRHVILDMEKIAQAEHLNDQKGICIYCQERTYRICAIQLVAAHLDDCKDLNEAQAMLTQRNKRQRWNAVVHKLRAQAPASEQPRRLLKRRSQYPVWVRHPELMENHAHRSIIALIRQMNSTDDELAWHTNLTTEERVDLLISLIQPKLNDRIMTATQNQQPMGALFWIFHTEFGLSIRPFAEIELNNRRRDMPSSTWYQSHALWGVIRAVLINVLHTFEESEIESRGAACRAWHWVNQHLGREEAPARDDWMYGK